MMAHRRSTPMRTWLAVGVVAAISLLVCAPVALAADESGGTESIFRFGPTARGIGLGASMIALGDDGSAVFWNPALLQSAPTAQVEFSRNRLAVGDGGASLQYVGLVIPTLGAGGFGVGMVRMGLGDVPTYDANSRPTGSIHYAQTQLLLGYGTGLRLPYIGGRVDAGVTAKVHRLELGESATSGGLDAGLLFQPPQLPRFSFALALTDLIAPSFRLVEQEDRLPHTSRYAVAYRIPAGVGRSVHVAASLTRSSVADPKAGLAAELELPGGQAARLGLAGGRFGVGLGARWRSYGLDYAYQSGSDLGASHYITLTWLIGESIAQKRATLAQQQQEEIERATSSAVARWLADQRSRSVQEADSLLAAGDLSAAERAVQQAEGFGADAAQLDPVRERLQQERERVAQQQMSDSERNARVALAAEQVRVALDAHDPLQARVELERLEKLAPEHPLLIRYRDELERQLATAAAQSAAQAQQAQAAGDPVAALTAWSQALRYAPEDEEAHRELARIQSDVQGARRQAEQADRELHLQQRYSQALLAFADGDAQRALSLCEAILRDAPSDVPTQQLAQRARTQLAGRPPLTPAQEAQVRSFYLAGLERFTAGDYAGAVSQWQQILSIDPDNQGALGNIREARSRMMQLNEQGGGGSAGGDTDGGAHHDDSSASKSSTREGSSRGGRE